MRRSHVAVSTMLALTGFACASASGDAEPVSAEADGLTAVSLPGRVQAEGYKRGGEGVGYHDTTKGNSGGADRQDDVDIEISTDTGGGFDVGWTAAGEWLAYDVSAASAGSFDVTVRLASAFADPSSVHLEIDGAIAGTAGTLSGGSGWQAWNDVSLGTVTLPAGAHVMKLVLDTGKINVDYVDLTAAKRAPIVFGMYNNTAISPNAETNSAQNYRAIADRYFASAKTKVHRVFDQSLPSSYAASAGADDPAHGNVSFLSVKPPGGDHRGVAAGTYDAAIRSLAASMPHGSYLTMFHEPENDMTGADFVAMFRRFYSVAKAANPSLGIGYVAMEYQWRPGMASTKTPDEWFPGAGSTDFLAVDAYAAGWSGPQSLDVLPGFQRWFGWADGKNKPLVLTEYGVEDASTGGFSDAVRAGIIQRSTDWVWAHPKFGMMLYWNGTSATPGGKNHFLNPTTSEPNDDFTQARAAWNAAVTAHGSTGTTFLP